jgi:hypothetical protein
MVAMNPITRDPKSPRLNLRPVVSVCVSLILGALVGIILHQLVYRFSLPAQPFVYAAF